MTHVFRMNKMLLILASVLLLMVLFVSCNQDIRNPDDSISVSLSISCSYSKSLASHREEFDSSRYLWLYTAEKNDSSGFESGVRTEMQPLKENDLGIDGACIKSISQGYWNFTVYGYGYENVGTEAEPIYSRTELVWVGSILNVLVKKGDSNDITIVVSPVSDGVGSVFFDTTSEDALRLVDENGSAVPGAVFSSYSIIGIRNDVDIRKNHPHESDFSVNLLCGAYKVSVSFSVGDAEWSETFVVNVYSGLETSVCGSVTKHGP